MPSNQSLRVAPGQLLLSGLAIMALAAATPGFAQIPPRTSGPQQVSVRPATPPTPATLPIKSSMLLCGIVDCGPAQVISQPAPIIAQVGPASVIEPGGNVLIHGTGFNARNGSYGTVVLIVGDLRALGHREFVLQNTQWSNKAAFGQIPSDISGLIDQVAWVQVRRTDGANSDPAKVQFIARRATAVIRAGDLHVQCSTMADQNQCNTWADYSPLWVPNDQNIGPLSFYAHHTSFLGQNSGTDQFTFTLKNSWVFENLGGAEIGGVSCPKDHSAYPILPPAGSSQGTFTVSWTAACGVYYGQWAAISGPQGVPWN